MTRGTVTVFSRSEIGVQISRYTGSGAPDNSFGANGSLLLPPTNVSYLPWFIDAAPRPGGGYFVAFANEYDLDDDIAQTYHYLVTVRLGTGGKVTLYNGQTTGGSVHLIADVAGYFRG